MNKKKHRRKPQNDRTAYLNSYMQILSENAEKRLYVSDIGEHRHRNIRRRKEPVPIFSHKNQCINKYVRETKK